MILVKICGVTRIGDALHAAAAGAGAIGFNFSARSPRRIAPQVAAAIAAALPAGVRRVGVFVDARRDEIAELVDQVGLDAIQFHGDESRADCAGWHCTTIKAVRVRAAETLAQAADYPVDYLLADAYVPGQAGGTGRRVPLEWLAASPRERLILAGGLTAENVAAAVRQVRPAGVDVASGVETVPGIKDAEKVERFIANAHAA